MSTPATLPWFAAHEFRLAWRDWLAMMTAGRRVRGIVLFIVLAVFYLGLHLLAAALLGPWIRDGITTDKVTLVTVTGTGFLFWTVMLSQALESVTRAYYSRSDLDLLLSSPASSASVFAVRTGAIAFGTVLLACLLASPIINVLIAQDGARWLAAYGVLAGLGALAATLSVLVTIGLFRAIGPARTRLVAQIIAGIVGAGFVIGIQAVAILSLGNMNRYAVMQSPEFVAAAPELSSLIWLPARAAMGGLSAMLLVLLIGFGSLVLVIRATSGSFARHAIAAAGVSAARVQQSASTRPFRKSSQRHALRVKEWKLLRRDPWLLSQTLMQILYLFPPALFLWVSYGQSAGTYVVVIPVIVMAAGQLAGGLSWLAISGEDAHDLVVTAPIHPRAVLIAKIEAVLVSIAVVFGPVLLFVAIASVELAAITGLFVAISAGSATAIQLWFRVPMRRAMFRRRQVASRAATISEALSSIMWAGAAVLAAGNQWIAALPAILAVVVLAVAYALSPKGKRV
ncbi:permease [Devosia sp. ZB163]|uniref:permease n=1 Tax=Devosia sp. ZB163 TaxID=3025938 RepID=UPI002362D12E|nr:permease [Devosia sp. ZB163]MDC9825747.1 permease [Devosia sp. ZB163]